MFSVSARLQYGIRALVRLYQADGQGLSIGDIAALESISPKFLEGIAAQLKAAGIIESQRGKNGGYRLARPAKDISMLDVAVAIEGNVAPVACAIDSGSCERSACCLPKRFWVGLKGRIDGYFSEVKLEDLASGVLEGEGEDDGTR